MDEPTVLLGQASHRRWKGRGDTLNVMEPKPTAGIRSQNKNMMHQSSLCGNGSPLTEEEPPQPGVACKALLKESLPWEERNQPSNGDWQRATSSSLYKVGRDHNWETDTLPLPKDRIQTDDKPSLCFSRRRSQETREAEFPTVNRTITGIFGNSGQGAPKLPGSRILKHDTGRKQPLMEEAQLGKETDAKVDKGLLFPTGDPLPSGQELQGDLCLPAGQKDDPYNYIEDFLSEGALVNIDSAQTCVNLGTGTIQTSVEISAEGEGVEVRHEVEWVTQFEQSPELK